MDLWPRRFYVYLGSRRIPPNDIKAWVKRYPPPICALMADKLPDPNANALNQTNFANLSRMLLEGQMVSSCTRFSSATFLGLTQCVVGVGALGPRQSARCWDDDLPNLVVLIAPCRSDILDWAFPGLCYVPTAASAP